MRKLDPRLCSICKRYYQPRSRQKYCSLRCRDRARIGKKHSLETLLKISKAHKGNKWCVGRKLSESTKELIRQANLGKNNHNYGTSFSQEHRQKISKAHKLLVQRGIHHAWRGGVSALSDRIRHSLEYKIWRESVFKRDNYTCILCGVRSDKGIKVILNADHIKPFALFPELRFTVENGRTLCLTCHKTTKTFGVNLACYVA